MTSHNRNTEGTKLSSQKPTRRKRSCYVPPCPVAELPGDILREILVLFATIPDTEAKCRAATILSFSHVCAVWREVALGCTGIWAYAINYESHQLRWIEELLERSSLSPLTIVDGSGRPVLWAGHYDPYKVYPLREDLLLKHKHRWRHLSFTSNSREFPDMKILPQYILQPSANIEALVWERLGESYHLKRSLFAGHAPALRSLDLIDVWIDIDALDPISGQLEQLCLTWSNYWHASNYQRSPPISCSQWVQLLRATPRLRYLFLRHDGEAQDQTVHIPRNRIILNHLEVVYLELADPTVCKDLMDSLAIPDKCGFLAFCQHPRQSVDRVDTIDLIQQRVELWDKGSSPDRVLYAQRQATKWYSAFSNFELPKDTPAYMGAFTTYRKAFDSIVLGEICPADPPMAFRVGLLRSDSQTLQFEVFLSMLFAFKSSFPETPRLHLWIKHWKSKPENEISFLHSALSELGNVKTLEVSTTYYDTFFSVLKIREPGTILLPSLQMIRFVPDRQTKLREEDLKRIECFTQWRIDQGIPLSTIDLNGLMLREVSETDVFEDLTEMVVVWD